MHTPRMRVRVVCTLCVTMLTFAPTIRFRSVDLPALGSPIKATKPARVSVFMIDPHVACFAHKGFMTLLPDAFLPTSRAYKKLTENGTEMGLLRMLLRALAPSRRPRHVTVRQETTLVRNQTPDAPRIAVRQSTEIRIVEVLEQRGPAWVIDGDTIDIKGMRIRLAGIDAPEMDQPYGKTAKWALVNLCKGQEVRAVFDGDLSHDRTVATCYLPDGRDLSPKWSRPGLQSTGRKFSQRKIRGA